jgi:hypothetical protein
MSNNRKIKELYVGAFTVAVNESSPAETILFGNRYGVLQATIEHELGAVPHLISLCDEIATYEGFPWRLLKFDEDGVHELDKDEYRNYSDFVVNCGVHSTGVA